MGRIKFKIFFITLFLLILAPSAWSVDLNCPGGSWVAIKAFPGGCMVTIVPPTAVVANLSLCGTTTTGGKKFEKYVMLSAHLGSGYPPCETDPCNLGNFNAGWIAVYEWKCPCTAGQTQPCPYSGPAGTEGVGICRAGTQTCQNGYWASCQGEVLPQQEVCGDGIDNNCNGQIDEGCCADNDGDGYYGYNAQSCPQGNDCDDNDPNKNPQTIWYKDTDNDGYSDGTTMTSCTRPGGFKPANELKSTSGDSDDTDGSIYPGAPEICDGKDNNQNGQTDEGCGIELPETMYQCEDKFKTTPPYYDTTTKSICSKGCLLSSLTMVLDYYLNKKGMPMVDVESLNEWLKNNNGFKPDGRIDWDAIEQYQGADVFYDWKGSNTASKEALDKELADDHPVILNVKDGTHFVIATGKENDTYKIIDPGYTPQATTLQERYNNKFDGIRIVRPK